MARYTDKITARNKVKITLGGLYFTSYEDFFFGEWVGNINVFDGDKMLMHATTKRALSKEGLVTFATEYILAKEREKEL